MQVIQKQEFMPFDFGPRPHADSGLGIAGQEEYEAIEDVADPDYIDRRLSTGFHCMDDRVYRSGIQLPGGIITTKTAINYLDSSFEPTEVHKDQARETKELTQLYPGQLWFHGYNCTADDNLQGALYAAAAYDSITKEFGGVVAEQLKIPVSDEQLHESIFTGFERANNRRLWRTDYSDRFKWAAEHPDIQTENFRKPHTFTGLAVFLTPHRFNNQLFTEHHRTTGTNQKIGVLAVTIGAFQRKLDSLVNAGFYDPARANRDIIRTAIFTAGLAIGKIHEATATGIVVPRNN